MTNCLHWLFSLCFICLFNASALAQKSFRSQLAIMSENDNYTLKLKDRYYTNGVNIKYTRLLRDGSALESKKLFSAELTHKIYNPYKQDVDFAKTLDRPFTGFLYVRSGLTYITPRENIFRWSGQAGLVGAAALGKELQSWHHRNFGLPMPHGWETQLKSEFGMNMHASYYQHLFRPTKKQKVVDGYAKADLAAGTQFTAASTGLVFRLGAFERGDNSTYFDARLHSDGKAAFQKKSEFFFYFEPSVTYQIYNATVQGGFFRRKQDQYSTSLQPLVYSHSFGLQYAQSQWTLQLGFTYKTKEATTMKADENYGTIAIAYRFN